LTAEKQSLRYKYAEKMIIELVKNAGDEGVVQRELWKKIGLDSRRGIKIIRKLEQQGVISREEIVYKGRKTYILKPATMMRAQIEIPSFLDEIPCVFCPDLPRCESNLENVANCEILNKWIEERKRRNDP